MIVVLQDGEVLRGTIEWYDRNCIKLHRMDAPNLLVLKHNVKYMYKDEDAKEYERDEADSDQSDEITEEE